MTLYKIIENGKSCHGGSLAWELPKKGKPGKWHEVSGDLKICENGIHLTDKPFLWYRWNCTVYEAEYDGEIIWDKQSGKCAVRKARLLKEVPHPTWWNDCHRFVERDIPSVKWWKPDNKPLPEWKMHTGKTLAAAWAAARAAAWAAARDAARAAALAAAWAAALQARIFVCSDLKLDPKHIEHARKRWEVWQKGYALLGDVNGVLYVYAKEEP